MEYQNLLTSLDKGVFTITINRPDKLNAINKATMIEIGKVFEEVYNNRAIHAVIITGSGNKAFVAGADVTEFLQMSNQQGMDLAAYGHGVYKKIEDCPKPVIAAVNGFALGGGCELAMACHMRVASDNAKFGQPEVKLGLVPGYGATQRLVQLIGKSNALELLMTADMIGAAEAHQLGLVNHVCTPEELQAKCLSILEKTMAQSPKAINGIINCVSAYFTDGIDGFDTEIKEFSKCFGTDDFVEGTSAFLEKRKATFAR